MSIVTRDAADLAGPLRQGLVVAYPTEAVFGIGCDPRSESAVAGIVALKSRTPQQGLLLIGADFAQVAAFIDMDKTPDTALARAMATWPGPFTWIFPASALVPSWLKGSLSGIALRVTAHPPAARVCAAFGGAIVSTSANPHGAQPAGSALETLSYFPSGLSAILDGPTGGASRPSTIADALTGNIVRP